MALFRPITTPADLPPVGTSRENGTFDFKEAPNPPDARELAKDVAAFANALGGVILVGTVEDRRHGTLGTYKPIGQATDAESLKKAYELAVTQRCLSQPVIDVVRIETNTAPAVNAPGNVVAVNVYPMPMGPVGVRWEGDNAYAFPLRTATQTHWMKPTELAMLMVPEIRRAAILLDSIPLDQRDNIKLLPDHIEFTGGIEPGVDATLTEIDPSLTTFTVQTRHPIAGRVALPIDCVKSVWRREPTRWSIAIGGRLSVRGGRIFFTPSRS